MAELSITVTGLDELRDRFGSVHPIIRAELRRAMTRAVMGELSRMPSYPPARPNSTYRRTGYLGRSLTAVAGSAPGAASAVREDGGNIVGIVGTNVVYAPQVIGPSQADPFRGRWWQLEGSVMSHKAQIEAEFVDAAKRISEQLAR